MPMQGGGGPMGGMPMGGGGSFLGTAAAVAAGAIGGGLLMNGIRSAMGGQGKSPFSGAFDQLTGNKPGGGEGVGSLGKEAGLDDVGASRRFGAADLEKEDSSSGLDELESSFEEEDDVGQDDDTE